MTSRHTIIASLSALALTEGVALAQNANIVPENHECPQGQIYHMTLETASETAEEFHARSLPAWTPDADKRYRGPRLDWNELADENYLSVEDRCGSFELELYIQRGDHGWEAELATAPGEVIRRNSKPTVLVRNLSRYIGQRAERHHGDRQITAHSEFAPIAKLVDLLETNDATGQLGAHDRLIQRLNRCRSRILRSGHDGSEPWPAVSIALETTQGGIVVADSITPDAEFGHGARPAWQDEYVSTWVETVLDCAPLDALDDGHWTIHVRDDQVVGIEPNTP